jgi:hypothetical protein
MRLKTSRIAFAIEDTSGKRHSQPRVVVTLTADDAGVAPIDEVQRAIDEVVATAPPTKFMPLTPSLSDERLHVIPCKDCVRLLWVDRAGGVLEAVVCSPGALAEGISGLLSWSKRTESVWSKHVD